MKSALYSGSFDPLTLGHLKLIERGLSLFDRLVVGVAVNDQKRPFFTADERVALIREACGDNSRLQIERIQGLLVDSARALGASVILRGLRGAADLEYEAPMAQLNRDLAPDLETLFLFADPVHAHVSSKRVREVASLGGDVGSWVPPNVLSALTRKFPSTSQGKAS